MIFRKHKIQWKRGLLSLTCLNRWTVRLRHKKIPALESFKLHDRIEIGPLELSFYRHNFPSKINKKNHNFILGISGSWHDSAAVILRNGEILSALEEERISRIKHDSSQFPVQAIDKLLTKFCLHWKDIDHIAIGWDYNFYIDTPHSCAPNDRQFHRLDEMYARGKDIPLCQVHRRDVPERNKARYQPQAVGDFLDMMGRQWQTSHRPLVSFVKHHWAHAASAYYSCGLPEPVLVITIDGYGDGETTTVWLGQDSCLRKITSIELPNSLGWVYSSVTEYLGFHTNAGEGEVMALAPYGKPRSPEEEQRVTLLRRFMDDFVQVNPHDGTFRVNSEFLYYGEFLPGRARVTRQMMDSLSYLVPPNRKLGDPIDPNLPNDRPYANLAFVLQEKTEAVVVNIVRHFLYHDPRTRGAQSVALSGGVAYNINANGRLLEQGLVAPDRLFIQPAAGDAGTSLGAAMVVSYEVYGIDPRFRMSRVDYGPSYCDEEIEAALATYGFQEGREYRKVASDEEVAEIVAHLLAQNHVVAWFQGRSEFGPRALGYRSILINILDTDANNLANCIKNRQHWRPSAMSITQESISNYICFNEGPYTSFMIVACALRKTARKIVPSGHHSANGSTRLHAVREVDNPLFWNILNKLGGKTGTPAVVNTSFNKQEPIIESPFDALKSFLMMDKINYLFIGKYFIDRHHCLTLY